MERQKIVLLRSAWRRGLGSFVAQAARSGRDSLWSKRNLVYRITAEEVLAAPPANPHDGVAFRQIRDWSELAPDVPERMDREVKGWGRREWLDEGWDLWAGEEAGVLVCLGWWRTAAQSEFFVPLPDGAELLWQTSVTPTFRGRRILDASLVSLMQDRARAGVPMFYASCRDFNTTSRRMFARTGWTYVGYGVVPKFGPGAGRSLWRPAAREIPARALEGMA